MIIGSISFSTRGNKFTFKNKIRELAPSGTVFNQVTYGCFSGGYCLHNNLPYKSDDFYYADEINDLVVLLSGSVYNKAELLNHFNFSASVPDPELVADLFRCEGPDYVKRLNGDYTIFIVQPAMKKAYLFRDHLGIRPMAWTMDHQTLLFSSDIIGLCREFSAGQVINNDYLLGYFKYIDYRKTPSREVTKLLPGHYLRFSESGIKIIKYWEPEKIRYDKNLSHDRMLEDLKSILGDAVKIRCDRRFTAGAHVSSGLDSGIVSALARKEYASQDSFYGFSWSPAGFTPGNVKFDERELVIKSCKKTNIQPLFADMSLTDFLHIVSGFYNNNGFFSEDKTLEQASEVKVNLIFSGWGGDEFISSGDRGIDTDLLFGLKLRTFFRRNKITHPGRFIKDLLIYVLFPLLGIVEKGTAKSLRNDTRYLKRPFKKSDRGALRNFYFHTSRRQHHLGLLGFYHLQKRCESWAINGYCKGVEYRYPLLDRRIIEYMLKIPSELLCKTDHFRPLLRLISKGVLPDEVRLNRYKNDPVYWSYMDELFKEAAIFSMEEINEWKADQDLHFIDFDLLTKDIVKYKGHMDNSDVKILFRALVYIKAIHAFTKKYHGL
jgi:asparagine synthase (glutamine-hydrolysing)